MHCNSDTTQTSVAKLSVPDPIISSHHFRVLSVAQSPFLFATISSYHRALCARQNCLSLLGDWSEHNSVCVQRETISAVYVSVCFALGLMGVCTHVRGAGVQGLYWTNSLTYHLSELRQDQTRYKENKTNGEILDHCKKMTKRNSNSVWNDCKTCGNDFGLLQTFVFLGR